MSTIAFLNDSTVKEAALRRALSDDSVGWKVEDTDEERALCAERFGLSPSLLNLLCHGFHVPYGQDARQKLHRALESITPGADTLALVRDWSLALWDKPACGLKAQVEGTAVAPPAQEAIRLIRASATETVPRELWRRARKNLAAAKGVSQEQDELVDLLVAMSFDLAQSPRATTDIWDAWQALVVGPVNRAAGWPQQLQDEVVQAVRDAHIAVHEEVGTPPDDPEAAHAHHAVSQERLTAYLEKNGFQSQFVALQEHAMSTMIPAISAWRAVAEQSVIDACRLAQQARVKP